MSIILFEDDQVANLAPVTLSRPAFAITCGGYRLIELLADLDRPISWRVRPHLESLLEADLGSSLAGGQAGGPTLLVNAALVPDVRIVDHLRQLLDGGEGAVVRCGSRLALAVLPTENTSGDSLASADQIDTHVTEQGYKQVELDLAMLDYPHEILRHHMDILEANLSHRIRVGQFQEVRDGVFLAAGATLDDSVVTDSSAGPIVIDEGASIGPHSFMQGPVYVGQRARVSEHASIKDCTTLAHTTKTGGEVEASIIEPYTNKQHHGFLGHSYLGSWINLGAGTCNSDLKNTYGTVNMEYQGRRVPTGMQFVGCFMGDYVKTAINTGIFTGKTIGACTMVYGFVTTNVPSFVNYARLFGQESETPVEVMIATQARMFARRNVQQRPCDVELLRSMFELTRRERQLGDEPLSL